MAIGHTIQLCEKREGHTLITTEILCRGPRGLLSASRGLLSASSPSKFSAISQTLALGTSKMMAASFKPWFLSSLILRPVALTT